MPLEQTSLGVIDKMSRAELKRAIVMCFEYAPDATPINRLAVLQEAEFYTRELERRADSRTSIRDLVLEIVVILLIGGEILLGYRQGRDEAKASALEQQVLSNLQASSAATVSTLQSLKKTTEEMNKNIQTEVALNYDVAVEVTFDNQVKHVNISNKGRTNVYVWGDKLDQQKPLVDTKGRMIAPGGYYYIIADTFFEELSKKMPNGSERLVPFAVFLKNENGDEFIVDCQFFASWTTGPLMIHTQTMSVKRAKWDGKGR
jgi:hypothetical protein